MMRGEGMSHKVSDYAISWMCARMLRPNNSPMTGGTAFPIMRATGKSSIGSPGAVNS